MRILILVYLVLVCACTSPGSTVPFQETAQVKRIALTFDDGPRGAGPRFSGDERAVVLIDALAKSSGKPAAFFVTTSNFKRKGGLERIQRYAEAGHVIANHTHSHHWLSRTNASDYISDIDRAEYLLRSVDNRRSWFRFPYLDEGRSLEKRNQLREALASRELFNAYVTVDNYDWYIERKWKDAVEEGKSVDLSALQSVYVDMLTSATEFFDDLAVEALGRSPAHVLLLHENDVAALFVDDLVAAFKAKGWEIISPDEAYADPMAKILPTTLMTRQGHVAALAVEAGRDPRTLNHWAIEESKIDQMLIDRNVFSD